MRRSFFLILVLLSLRVFSQADTSAVLTAVVQVEKALVDKDRDILRSLMHEDIMFGHSSGWVQNKSDVFKDMESGFLVYKVYNRESLSIEVKKKKAFVKEVVSVEGTRNKVDFKMRLFVSQLWVKTKKGWKLLFRQSTRL